MADVMDVMADNPELMETVYNEFTSIPTLDRLAAAARIVQSDTPADDGYTPHSYKDVIYCKEPISGGHQSTRASEPSPQWHLAGRGPPEGGQAALVDAAMGV